MANDRKGAIELPTGQLEITVVLTPGGDRAWTGTIDIPAQGLRAVELSSIAVESARVHLEMGGVPGQPTVLHALMVAVADKSVRFLVLLAPSGEPLRSLLMRQTRDLYRRQGLDEKLIDRALANQAEDLELIADSSLTVDRLQEKLRALAETRKAQFTVEERARLGVDGEHVETGSIEEYAEIEETFAPEALDMIGDWIVARFPRGRNSAVL